MLVCPKRLRTGMPCVLLVLPALICVASAAPFSARQVTNSILDTKDVDFALPNGPGFFTLPIPNFIPIGSLPLVVPSPSPSPYSSPSPSPSPSASVSASPSPSASAPPKESKTPKESSTPSPTPSTSKQSGGGSASSSTAGSAKPRAPPPSPVDVPCDTEIINPPSTVSGNILADFESCTVEGATIAGDVTSTGTDFITLSSVTTSNVLVDSVTGPLLIEDSTVRGDIIPTSQGQRVGILKTTVQGQVNVDSSDGALYMCGSTVAGPVTFANGDMGVRLDKGTPRNRCGRNTLKGGLTVMGIGGRVIVDFTDFAPGRSVMLAGIGAFVHFIDAHLVNTPLTISDTGKDTTIETSSGPSLTIDKAGTSADFQNMNKPGVDIVRSDFTTGQISNVVNGVLLEEYTGESLTMSTSGVVVVRKSNIGALTILGSGAPVIIADSTVDSLTVDGAALVEITTLTASGQVTIKDSGSVVVKALRGPDLKVAGNAEVEIRDSTVSTSLRVKGNSGNVLIANSLGIDTLSVKDNVGEKVKLKGVTVMTELKVSGNGKVKLKEVQGGITMKVKQNGPVTIEQSSADTIKCTGNTVIAVCEDSSFSNQENQCSICTPPVIT